MIPLLLIAVQHIPIPWYAGIIVGMQHYFLFMDLSNSLMQVCGNSILYILIGISLPSLPVSNLNLHISIVDCFLFLVLQLGVI